MTRPKPLAPTTGCPVTVWPPSAAETRTHDPRRCGEPVVARGLCAKHLADRRRLGRKP